MIPLYNHFPSIDLHGLDRDYAKIVISDFIYDQYRMKKTYAVIIHGNGSGVLKKITQDTLKHNPYVLDYKIDNFNTGQTIVSIRKNS